MTAPVTGFVLCIAVFQFIEGFFNPRRRHTSIGNISPTEMEFERRYMDHAA